MGYDIILADPPWRLMGHPKYENKGLKGRTDHATIQRPYTWSELQSLPIDRISNNNTLLFMWMTGPLMPYAIEVAKQWGFSWVSMAFVWNRLEPIPDVTWTQCDFCGLFVKGEIPPRKGVMQFQYVESDETKPWEVRDRITRLYPNAKRIELFSERPLSDEWDVWKWQPKQQQEQKATIGNDRPWRPLEKYGQIAKEDILVGLGAT